MGPWEIWTYDFPVEGTHPCVLFTNSNRLSHADFDRVNVFLCRTLRAPIQGRLKASEVLLDRADGLDWETICRVDSLHFVPKAQIHTRRGLVSVERRRAISQAILKMFPFQF